MWNTRCDIIHEKMEYRLPLDDSRHILEDIKYQYLLVMVGFPPGDTHLLYQPLDATLKILSLTKKNWLRLSRIYRQEVATERASYALQ